MSQSGVKRTAGHLKIMAYHGRHAAPVTEAVLYEQASRACQTACLGRQHRTRMLRHGADQPPRYFTASRMTFADLTGSVRKPW